MRAKKLNNKISAQKMMLEHKNKEITDSINYAQRIQSAILPSSDYVNKTLPNSFVLYKPKDIVAGDFYWIKKVNDNIVYATADCTGHGVPGAMVSVVCSNSLNQSIKELKTANPAEILEMTRTLVKESFKSKDDNVKDGMDITLCSINYLQNTIQFTGANNPLYIIRNKQIIEVKGDKQPVGNHIKEVPFTVHTMQLEKNDVVYTFSDGYVDQFGGEKGKKFMRKRFKALLLKISNKPMQEQKSILNNTFETWRGELEQVDDVCVIGIRV
jgi:serine phosphatase RsbU (regulator of sigma subunit)